VAKHSEWNFPILTDGRAAFGLVGTLRERQRFML